MLGHKLQHFSQHSLQCTSLCHNQYLVHGVLEEHGEVEVGGRMVWVGDRMIEVGDDGHKVWVGVHGKQQVLPRVHGSNFSQWEQEHGMLVVHRLEQVGSMWVLVVCMLELVVCMLELVVCMLELVADVHGQWIHD